ncbi:MAG: sugar ABC transporter substrate-binding protein [Clostridia bacterium]
MRGLLGKIKRMRRLKYVLLILGLALLLVGSLLYFSVGIGHIDGREDSLTFGFTISTMNNPFCSCMENTLRALVERDGNKLVTLDPQYDQQKQLDQIDEMLDEGIDLLFLCPVNYNDITSALLACAKKNVPIINFDCDVAQMQYVETIVHTDNYKAGFLCGQDIMRRLPNGATIAIIDDQKARSVVKRMAGFLDALSDPAYKIIRRLDSDGSLESAMPIVRELLQTCPQLDVIMCANDTVASGAVAAIQIGGNADTSIMVYGIDGSPDAKTLVKDKKMTATAAQSTINLAKNCYDLCLKIIAGGEVPKEVLVDTYLIDQSNIAKFDINGWQ